MKKLNKVRQSILSFFFTFVDNLFLCAKPKVEQCLLKSKINV